MMRLDTVDIRVGPRDLIGWMSDWGAPFSRGWVDKGWVTTVDHNSGGLGGFSYQLTELGKRRLV